MSGADESEYSDESDEEEDMDSQSGEEGLDEADENASEVDGDSQNDETSEEEDDDDDEVDDDEKEEEEDMNDSASVPSAVAGSSKDGDEEICCPICLNPFVGQDLGSPENCNHMFCLECIEEWAKNINTCPIDRKEFENILMRLELGGDVLKKIKVKMRRKAPEDFTGDGQVTLCEVCGRGDREETLLLCDSCDLGYHCECLTPPLSNIPVNEWFCPPCVAVMQRTGGSLSSSSSSRTRRGRIIPRTRVTESVRTRIQLLRTSLLIDDDDNWEDQSFEPGPSSSRVAPLRPRRTPTVRRYRKTRRRRRTVKKKPTLARTKKTTQQGKGGGKRTTTTGKTRRKRTKRKTRRKSKKSPRSQRSRFMSRPLAAPSTKQRIADRLGICKPPSGSSMPYVRGSSGSGSAIKPSASLSVLGVRDQLMDFEEDFTESSNSAQPSTSQGISVQSNQNQTSSGRTSDILESILAGQSLIHKNIKDLTINSDGSLKLKATDSSSLANRKQISSTAVKNLGAMSNGAVQSPFRNISSSSVSSRTGNQKTGDSSVPSCIQASKKPCIIPVSEGTEKVSFERGHKQRISQLANPERCAPSSSPASSAPSSSRASVQEPRSSALKPKSPNKTSRPSPYKRKDHHPRLKRGHKSKAGSGLCSYVSSLIDPMDSESDTGEVPNGPPSVPSVNSSNTRDDVSSSVVFDPAMMLESRPEASALGESYSESSKANGRETSDFVNGFSTDGTAAERAISNNHSEFMPEPCVHPRELLKSVVKKEKLAELLNEAENPGNQFSSTENQSCVANGNVLVDASSVQVKREADDKFQESESLFCMDQSLILSSGNCAAGTAPNTCSNLDSVLSWIKKEKVDDADEVGQNLDEKSTDLYAKNCVVSGPCIINGNYKNTVSPIEHPNIPKNIAEASLSVKHPVLESDEFMDNLKPGSNRSPHKPSRHSASIEEARKLEASNNIIDSHESNSLGKCAEMDTCNPINEFEKLKDYKGSEKLSENIKSEHEDEEMRNSTKKCAKATDMHLTGKNISGPISDNSNHSSHAESETLNLLCRVDGHEKETEKLLSSKQKTFINDKLRTDDKQAELTHTPCIKSNKCDDHKNCDKEPAATGINELGPHRTSDVRKENGVHPGCSSSKSRAKASSLCVGRHIPVLSMPKYSGARVMKRGVECLSGKRTFSYDSETFTDDTENTSSLDGLSVANKTKDALSPSENENSDLSSEHSSVFKDVDTKCKKPKLDSSETHLDRSVIVKTEEQFNCVESASNLKEETVPMNLQKTVKTEPEPYIDELEALSREIKKHIKQEKEEVNSSSKRDLLPPSNSSKENKHAKPIKEEVVVSKTSSHIPESPKLKKKSSEEVTKIKKVKKYDREQAASNQKLKHSPAKETKIKSSGCVSKVESRTVDAKQKSVPEIQVQKQLIHASAGSVNNSKCGTVGQEQRVESGSKAHRHSKKTDAVLVEQVKSTVKRNLLPDKTDEPHPVKKPRTHVNGEVSKDRKEKLKKKISQEDLIKRIESEVKAVLKPYYMRKEITKEMHKDIMRKCVPKISNNTFGHIDSKKIENFVLQYVIKFKKIALLKSCSLI